MSTERRTDMLTARTAVATLRAARYLSQLCEHLDRIDHRTHPGPATAAPGPPEVQRVTWTEDTGVIEFRGGQCRLHADEGALTVVLAADDADDLTRMQQLLARRIETIGRRDGLTVTW